MSKAYNFDWQIEVSPRLLKGDYFDRWDEENGSLEQNCLFRVDTYGFFIYWQSDGRDGQVIELSQVSDIRPGKGMTFIQGRPSLHSLVFQLLRTRESMPILWRTRSRVAAETLTNAQSPSAVESTLYRSVIRTSRAQIPPRQK